MKYDPEQDTTPMPRETVRKGEGEMDGEELQSLVHGILSDCVEYVDTELSPGRAEATDYYLGKPLGNEEEGRSQYVATEVRDGIQAVLPSLLRIFFSGPDRTVEFAPRTKETVAQAEQATDYVQYVFTELNPGFMIAHAAIKDALIRKIGVIKWGWDEGETTAHEQEGLTQEQLQALVQQGAEPTTIKQQEDGTFDVKYTSKTEGRPWVKCIPPEELLLSRQTRDMETSLCLGHQTELTRGELIAMGIDEDEIEDAIGRGETPLRDSVEEISRREVVPEDGVGSDPSAGEANDKIRYIEAYVRLDYDGDGIAELRRICTIGEAYHVVHNDPIDSIPLAIGCPDPEPHTLIGASWADRLMDLQRVQSMLTRTTLDSFALSVFPRTAYVETQVAVEDILNTEIGAPIRMRAPGMVQPFVHPFSGKEVFPFFDHFRAVKEGRTGQNAGPSGLDADALQSSTPGAVDAAVQAAQEHKELLARIFAETLFKPLFRGLLCLLVEHQPRKQMVRLRGEWVEVDPSTFDPNMQVQVNIALGSTAKAQRISVLGAAASKAELILQTLGLDNPLCGIVEYSNILHKALELNGFKDSDQYFKRVPPDWKPPTPAAPQPTPEQVMAQAQMQIEQMKAMKDVAVKERELELKERELSMQHDRENTRLAMETQLKRYELELKYHGNISQQQETADAARMKAQLDAGLAHRQQDHAEAVDGHERALAEQSQGHEQALAEDQQAHDQQMAERQTAAAEQAAAAGPTA